MTKSVNQRTYTDNLRAYLWQVATTCIALIFIFQPWMRDWKIPFNYEGDTVFQLVLIKSMIQNGWTWMVPQLSAPMPGFEAISFPQNISFSTAIMKVISLFTREPGLVLNTFWLISIILTSVTCQIALRILKTPLVIAIVLSTLYALLPYTLMRNTNHLALTYIFTPIIAAYAIAIAGNSLTEHTHLKKQGVYFSPALLWFSCIAIGLDYIYTAFFSCFFLLIAALLALITQRKILPFKFIVVPLTLIIAFSIFNLLPTFWEWRHFGSPPNMGYKSLSDVEVYGLKIRHLLSSPALLELFPPFIKSTFLLENENRSAMLGLLGGLGFMMALIFGIVADRKNSQLLWSAGALTIIGTLLGTIGGFGAALSLILGADIRAYNRVSPFLAFFSFFTLSIALTWVMLKAQHLLRHWGLKAITTNIVSRGLLILIGGLALIDQSYALKPFLERYAQDKSQTHEERSFVEKLEITHPQLSSFYQLPETPFPVDAGINKMKAYDHGRPYLWSQKSNWSWPNFSHQGQMWLSKLGDPANEKFVSSLITSGFNAIWLDRNGYDALTLKLIQDQLRTQLGNPVEISETGRYEVYNLGLLVDKRERSSTELELKTERRNLLNSPIGLDFGPGFYPKELLGVEKISHRWAQNQAILQLYNFSDSEHKIRFRTLLSYNTGGKLIVRSNQGTTVTHLKDGKMEFSLSLVTSPRSKNTLIFTYDGPPVQAPNDERLMFLSFTNPTISVAK